MWKISQYIEDTFAEVALAEEWQRRNLGTISRRFTEGLESRFTAMAFAEAGEFETARGILGAGPGDEGHCAGYCAAGFCQGKA